MSPYLQRQPTIRQKKLAVRRWLLSTAFRSVLVGVFCLFGVLYVLQTSAVSTKGYAINDFKKQIQTLEDENQKLEFEIATHRSIQSIEERLKTTQLVVADNIEYVTLVGSAVALR